MPPTWRLWDHKQLTINTRWTLTQNLLKCPFLYKGANFEIQCFCSPPPPQPVTEKGKREQNWTRGQRRRILHQLKSVPWFCNPQGTCSCHTPRKLVTRQPLVTTGALGRGSGLSHWGCCLSESVQPWLHGDPSSSSLGCKQRNSVQMVLRNSYCRTSSRGWLLRGSRTIIWVCQWRHITRGGWDSSSPSSRGLCWLGVLRTP